MQEMQSGQAFLKSETTSTVKPACPEKYITECIEGVSEGGVRKRTEPQGSEFQLRI